MNFELNAYLVSTEQRRHHRTIRRGSAESSARARTVSRLPRHRRH
jgi:hypothetical protein